MKVNGHDHIYTVIPPFRNNKELPVGERIEIDLMGVNQADADSIEQEQAVIMAENHAIEKRLEMISASARKLVDSKFVAIRCLEVEGVGEIKTFDEFYQYAPKPLVGWVSRVVANVDVLLEHEVKN